MGDLVHKVVPVREEDIAKSIAPMPKNIALAINEVCRNAVKLNKTNKNNYQDYNFASIDDFLEVYGSTIAEAGISIIMDEVQSRTESKVLEIVFNFIIVHKDGDMWQHPLRRSIRVQSSSGSQAYGIAQSYCLKQFLRGIFMIPTGESKNAKPEPDADSLKTFDNNTNNTKFDNKTKSNGKSRGYSVFEDKRKIINGKFIVDVIKQIEDDVNKATSNDELDELYLKHKDAITQMDDGNMKTIKNTFEAVRSTIPQ